jgi:hypothetical protein
MAWETSDGIVVRLAASLVLTQIAGLTRAQARESVTWAWLGGPRVKE